MIKKLLGLFLLAFALLSGLSAQDNSAICYNPNLIKDTTKKSIKSMAAFVVSGDSMKIVYHSPGVRKRIIWGGLVPLDEVWVTGAHDATYLVMPRSFEMGGKRIPAGKYAIFSIPGVDEWTLILNKNWEQHLASEYDEKDDIVRVKVKPMKADHTERLQYFIEVADKKQGKISVAWEKVRVELPFTFRN